MPHARTDIDCDQDPGRGSDDISAGTLGWSDSSSLEESGAVLKWLRYHRNVRRSPSSKPIRGLQPNRFAALSDDKCMSRISAFTLFVTTGSMSVPERRLMRL